MQYYSFQLRLNGDVGNTLVMQDVSASEILLLKQIHGDDSIIDLKFGQWKDIEPFEVYDYLMEKYGHKESQKAHIVELFGNSANPRLVLKLPTKAKREIEAAITPDADQPVFDKEVEEADDIKAQLDEKGIKYHPNTGLAKLRSILERSQS